MDEPLKVVKPDSVPSLNFEKLKKKEGMSKFSPILKQTESDEEVCDCTECWHENEQQIEPIEFSDESGQKSVKSDLLEERREDF